MTKRKSKPNALHSPRPSTPSLQIADIVTDDEANEGEGPSTIGFDGTKGIHLSPCIFRIYFGKCGNEDTCKFSHSIKSIDPRVATPTSPPTGTYISPHILWLQELNSSDQTDAFSRSPKSNGARPCKLFLRGYCKHGRNCKFSHEQSAPIRTNTRGTGNSPFGSNNVRPTVQLKTNWDRATAIAPSINEPREQSSAFIEEIKEDTRITIALEDVGEQLPPSPGNDKSSSDERPPLTFDSDLNDPRDSELPADYDLDSHESDKSRKETTPVVSDDLIIESRVNENDDSGEDTWGWNESPMKNKVKTEDVWDGEDDETIKSGEERVVPESWDDSDDESPRDMPEEVERNEPDDVEDERNGVEDERNDVEDEWSGVDRNEPNDVEDERNGVEDEPDGVEDGPDGVEDGPDGVEDEPDGVEDELVGVQDGEPGYASNEGGDAEEHEYDQSYDAFEEEEGGQEQSAIEDYNPPSDQYTIEEEETTEEAEAERSEASFRSYSTPKPTGQPVESIEDGKDSEQAPISILPTPPRSQIQPSPEPVQIADANATPAAPPHTPLVSRGPQIFVMSLHWSRFADPVVDPQLPFCKAFAQNKCSNPTFESCKFRHCITPYEYTLLFKDPQPLQISVEKHLIRNDSSQNVNPITSPAITLHWSHFADPMCDSNVAFCKSYAENLCMPDKVCGFRHCLTLEEYTSLFKDPQPNLITTGSGISQQQAISPANAAGHPSQTQSTKRICAFFLKGTCKNGENCPYYHDTVSNSCPNIQWRGYCNTTGCPYCSTDKQHSTSEQPLPTPSAKPCQYWPKGTCRNGDSCGFAHIGEFGAAARNDRNENEAQVFDKPEDDSGFDQGDTGADEWANKNDEPAGNENQTWGDNEEKDEEGGNNEDDQWAKGWAHSNANDASGWDTTNVVTSGWEDQANDNSGRGKGSKSAYDRSGDWRNNDRTESNNDQHNNRPDTRKGWNVDKSSGICRQFQRGQCSRGSGCRFSHDLQLGRGSDRGSREASQPYLSKKDSTYTTQPEEDAETSSRHKSSKYGGRYQYDRGSIKDWNTEVAASEVGSEVGDGVGKQSDWRSRGNRSPDRRRAFSNRSVENPPAGNNSCQFYLGRCSNGDICTSSHDAAVAGNFEDLRDEEERRFSRRGIRNDGPDVKGRDAWREGMDQDECTPHAQYEATMANDYDAVPRVEHNRGIDKRRDDKPTVDYENVRTNERQHHEQGYCGAALSGHYQSLDPKQLNEIDDEQELVPERDPSEPNTRASEVDPQDSTEVRDYGHPFVERSFSGCTVIFDRDCLPEKVITATDSRTLILEGPPDITENRVHDAVNKYGPIEDIVIEREPPGQANNVSDGEQDDEASDASETDPSPPSLSQIRVEFQEVKDAAAAARDLNGTLDKALPVEVASTTATWLRFRWPLPSRAAWVYYPTIARAKAMEEKLHGSVVHNRKVTASFVRPDKRQKDLYAVKLEGLVALTKKEDLENLVEDAKLITVSELTYIQKPRDILEQLEGLKVFVNVPVEPFKVNAIAFARFDSDDRMLQALNMHGTKPKFLGGKQLVVEKVWFANYILPNDMFKVVSTEIAALHIRCEGHVTIESCDLVDRHMVYVYSSPEEGSAFAKANISLQAICRGSIVMDAENRSEWDEYLYSTSSLKVIEALNSKDKFFVFPNTLARQVHVLGSEQEKGASSIKKLLQKVRVSRQEYPIHRNIIRQLVNGGLSEIQTKFGANKLSLDALRSVLVIKGGDKDLMKRVRQMQESASSNDISTQTSLPGQICVICELQCGDRDSTVVMPCGHVYCVACLRHTLIHATQDHTAPVKCMGWEPTSDGGYISPCGQPISYTTARDLLPLLAEPEYLQITFTSFVLAHSSEYFFCPSLRCDNVYRYGAPRDITRCPVCETWICLFCGSHAHSGVDCKEAQENRAALLS